VTAATFTRPAASVLADAADAAALVVHEFATRATSDADDVLAYFLNSVAVAHALGIEPTSWVRAARATGATWTQIATAMNTTKGNVHGRFRFVDKLETTTATHEEIR
jgi:hypothetical protein